MGLVGFPPCGAPHARITFLSTPIVAGGDNGTSYEEHRSPVHRLPFVLCFKQLEFFVLSHVRFPTA